MSNEWSVAGIRYNDAEVYDAHPHNKNRPLDSPMSGFFIRQFDIASISNRQSASL